MLNGFLYFMADDGVHGLELWRTDGAQAALVADINPGEADALWWPDGLHATADRLYFFADDGVHGKELWTTDGMETRLVADVYPGAGYQVGSFSFATDGTRGYLNLNDGVHGQLPWVVEGGQVRPVSGGGSNPWGFLPLDGRVYFSGGSVAGRELWVIDDTTATMVADLWPGAGSSHAAPIVADGRRLLFSARTESTGMELWALDAAGVRLLADLNPGLGNSHPCCVVRYVDHLYFTAATSDTASAALWRLDGEQVVPVAGPGAGDTYGFGAAQGSLFVYTTVWTGTGSMDHQRLYRGTGDSFAEIAEMTSNGGWPRTLTEVGNGLYFHADDVRYGKEVWEVVGDSARLVADIMTGPARGVPGWMVPFDGRLFLWADDGVHGQELWAIMPPPVATEPVPASTDALTVRRVYPNPAGASASVEVVLGAPQALAVEVLDVLGRRVWAEDLGWRAAGAHALSLDTGGLTAGAYVVRVRGEAGSAVARFVVGDR